MQTKLRFAGLRLHDQDRVCLKKMQAGGEQMSVRSWRRASSRFVMELIAFCGVLPAVGGGFSDAKVEATIPRRVQSTHVDLVRSGRSVRRVARAFGVTETRRIGNPFSGLPTQSQTST